MCVCVYAEWPQPAYRHLALTLMHSDDTMPERKTTADDTFPDDTFATDDAFPPDDTF